MYYHISIEINEKNNRTSVYFELDKTDKVELLNSIIIPFMQGEEFQFNGYFVKKDMIKRLVVKTTDKTTSELAKYENEHLDRRIMMVITNESILSNDKYTKDITKSIMDEATEVLIASRHKKLETTLKSGKKYNEVFIVHGRDELAKIEVARFVEKLGFKAIILHEQENQGMTIIEKFEKFSNVDFGIVLYTPCDLGSLKENQDFKPRARQNVVFEHGFLNGKLGRDKVCALVKDNVEIPNDLSGLVYLDMDNKKAWQITLAKEMKKAGYNIDLNLI